MNEAIEPELRASVTFTAHDEVVHVDEIPALDQQLIRNIVLMMASTETFAEISDGLVL
jgi:hypothetical protein